MKNEKIVKAFSELYIGKNPIALIKEYYRKKQKSMLFLISGALLVFLMCGIRDLKNSELTDNKIIRNVPEEGKEEITLEMKPREGEWQEIEFILYPKEYTTEEIEELFLEAEAVIEEKIRNQNESLFEINSDLKLVKELDGYPFTIKWEIRPEGVLEESGELIRKYQGVEENVELKATFQYEDWEKDKTISVRVVSEKNGDYKEFLEEAIKKMEVDSREHKEFYLPEEYEEEQLQWRYPIDRSAIVMGFLFFTVIPIISYQKDNEILKLAGKRKEELQSSFPEFIIRLVLLMEAGLSLQKAMFQIAQDYQKRAGDKKEYLYEELWYICRQMKNGLPEKEAYILLSQRCNLPCYKKMTGLLIQHLQKGGRGILAELRQEAEKASEEQKRLLQKKGEEIGTKLLFPMILMLGIVMVFIMVPALFTFQI